MSYNPGYPPFGGQYNPQGYYPPGPQYYGQPMPMFSPPYGAPPQQYPSQPYYSPPAGPIGGSKPYQGPPQPAPNSNTGVNCDVCKGSINNGATFWHCSGCLSGDFDMCSACKTNGMQCRCQNNNANLVECVFEQGQRKHKNQKQDPVGPHGQPTAYTTPSPAAAAYAQQQYALNQLMQHQMEQQQIRLMQYQMQMRMNQQLAVAQAAAKLAESVKI